MNTVGELISELESFPPETPVVHHDDEEGNTVSKVSIGFMTDGDGDPVCVILSMDQRKKDSHRDGDRLRRRPQGQRS